MLKGFANDEHQARLVLKILAYAPTGQLIVGQVQCSKMIEKFVVTLSNRCNLKIEEIRILRSDKSLKVNQ